MPSYKVWTSINGYSKLFLFLTNSLTMLFLVVKCIIKKCTVWTSEEVTLSGRTWIWNLKDGGRENGIERMNVICKETNKYIQIVLELWGSG